MNTKDELTARDSIEEAKKCKENMYYFYMTYFKIQTSTGLKSPAYISEKDFYTIVNRFQTDEIKLASLTTAIKKNKTSY